MHAIFRLWKFEEEKHDFFFIYCKKIFFRVCWRLHRARNLCSQLCEYTAVASGQEKRRGMWELGYLQWPWNLRSIYILQVSRLLGGAAALSHSLTLHHHRHALWKFETDKYYVFETDKYYVTNHAQSLPTGNFFNSLYSCSILTSLDLS